MAGAKEGFFASLVPSVVASLGGTFPELQAQQARVEAVLARATHTVMPRCPHCMEC